MVHRADLEGEEVHLSDLVEVVDHFVDSVEEEVHLADLVEGEDLLFEQEVEENRLADLSQIHFFHWLAGQAVLAQLALDHQVVS